MAVSAAWGVGPTVRGGRERGKEACMGKDKKMREQREGERERDTPPNE